MEENNKGLRFYRIICRSSATLLFATFIFTWFHLAGAQQPAKVPRIGYIAPTGPENTNYAAFLRGLRDLGYIEGKNILVEYRSMEGNRDRIPSLMAELVQLQVDILVSPNAPTILAAKQATRTRVRREIFNAAHRKLRTRTWQIDRYLFLRAEEFGDCP